MSVDNTDANNVPNDQQDQYEVIASQEELYLEHTEEDVIEVLESEASSPSAIAINTDTCSHVDDRLSEAAEELITGDSDDPPLSAEAVVEMLEENSNSRASHECDTVKVRDALTEE